MITKVLYRCEYCLTDYASETSARECEDYHRKGLKIVSARYIPFNMSWKGAMPITITVEDNKGFRTIYKR